MYQKNSNPMIATLEHFQPVIEPVERRSEQRVAVVEGWSEQEEEEVAEEGLLAAAEEAAERLMV